MSLGLLCMAQQTMYTPTLDKSGPSSMVVSCGVRHHLFRYPKKTSAKQDNSKKYHRESMLVA